MKTVLLCFAVVAVTSTCSAYDFSDPEFNGIIEDELFEDSQFKKHHPRARRDIDEDEERSASTTFEHDDVDDHALQDVNEDRPSHGSHCRKHHKGCCGKPAMSLSFLPHTNNQTIKAAGSECYEEVNMKLGNKTYEDDMNLYNCEKVKRMKKRHICIHECKAKKQEVADKDGSLDFAKVKMMLTSRVNETWQKDLIEAAVDSCSNITFDAYGRIEDVVPTMANEDETWKADEDEYKCNPQALQFKHCVWKQVETNCPEEHRNTGRYCLKLRGKLAEKSKSDASSTVGNKPT